MGRTVTPGTTGFLTRFKTAYDLAGNPQSLVSVIAVKWCTCDGAAVAGSTDPVCTGTLGTYGGYGITATVPTAPGDYVICGHGLDDTGRTVYLETDVITIVPPSQQQIAQEKFGSTGTVWHIAATGSDTTGDGLTPATAYALPTKPICSAGDALKIGSGLFVLTAPISNSVPIKIIGCGKDSQLVTDPTGSVPQCIVLPIGGAGADLVVENLTIICHNITHDGEPISFTSMVNDLTVRRCYIEGDIDGVFAYQVRNASVEDCVLTSHYDCCNIQSFGRVLVRNCRNLAIGDGTSMTRAVSGVAPKGYLVVDSELVATNSGAQPAYGCTVNGSVLVNVKINTSNSGSGGAWDIYVPGGTVTCYGCDFDRTKTEGTIIDLPLYSYFEQLETVTKSEMEEWGLTADATPQVTSSLYGIVGASYANLSAAITDPGSGDWAGYAGTWVPQKNLRNGKPKWSDGNGTLYWDTVEWAIDLDSDDPVSDPANSNSSDGGLTFPFGVAQGGGPLTAVLTFTPSATAAAAVPRNSVNGFAVSGLTDGSYLGTWLPNAANSGTFSCTVLSGQASVTSGALSAIPLANDYFNAIPATATQVFQVSGLGAITRGTGIWIQPAQNTGSFLFTASGSTVTVQGRLASIPAINDQFAVVNFLTQAQIDAVKRATVRAEGVVAAGTIGASSFPVTVSYGSLPSDGQTTFIIELDGQQATGTYASGTVTLESPGLTAPPSIGDPWSVPVSSGGGSPTVVNIETTTSIDEVRPPRHCPPRPRITVRDQQTLPGGIATSDTVER